MITKIITHNRPHVDELVALMLLKKFPEGEEKFPGVKNATVSFMTTGELPDGKTANDFPDTIFLGCGGGMFDEHATSQKERVEGECCATLVAKYLGIENDPGLQKILTFIRSEDLKGTVVKNELPMMVKFLHATYGNKYEEISKWVEDAYYAVYLLENKKWESIKNDSDSEMKWREMKGKWQRPTIENTNEIFKEVGYTETTWWNKFIEEAKSDQKRRFEEARVEFNRNAIVERVTSKSGRVFNIAFIESDNEEMNKLARSIGMHIVIQFNSKGNCFIVTDRKQKIDLTFAFILIRMAEQHYRGEVKIRDEEILSKEGFVAGIPYWYLFHTKDMGFNGSLTTTDVEPTKIPKEKLFDFVKEGIKNTA
jgi:hypothetical protein